MKKHFFYLVLTVLMLCIFCIASNAQVYDGNCGDALTWSFDDATGELLIEGSGRMTSYYSVGDSPWYVYRNQIKSISFSGEITSIGGYAFSECTEIESIAFPETVDTVGAAAFYGCSALSEVDLSNVTTLEGASFAKTAIESVVIPSSLRTTGTKYVGNTVYAPFAGSALRNVTFEEGIESVPTDCFSGCASLEKIKFAESIKNIGRRAFYGCISLSDVSLPEGLTTIGESAFNGCVSITRIEFPDALRSVDSQAFYECTALSEADLGRVETLGGAAFGKTAIESIVIPSTLKSTGVNYVGSKPLSVFGDSALKNVTFEEGIEAVPTECFSGCASLEGIEFAESIKNIGRKAFYGCISLSDVSLPEGLTTIGESAFNGCVSITRIEFPDALRSVDSQAFYECTALSEADLGRVETLGGAAFGKTSIEKIHIPNTLTETGINYISGLPVSPFGNGILKAATFEEGTETIPEDCFAGCAALEKAILPDSVKIIKDSAFALCCSLTEFDLPKSLETIKNNSFEGCVKLSEVIFPETLKAIGIEAFYGCSELSRIDLSRVESIGGAAFVDTKIESVVIPNTLVQTGISYISGVARSPFSGKVLKNVLFEEGLKSIPENCFNGCTGLYNVKMEEGITAVGENAFRNCTTLKDVFLPYSTELIGDCAFYGCERIEEMVFPTPLKSVGSEAFYGCTSLKSVDLASVGVLGGAAFSNTAIESVFLPKTLAVTSSKYVGGVPLSPFGGSTLKNVVLEEGMEIIPDYCFRYCSGITSISVPESVNTIDGWAFEGCSSLEEVYIEGGVDKIGDYAFDGCTSLKRLNIGSTSEIGSHAFRYCDELMITINSEDSKTAILLIDQEASFEALESGIKDSEERRLDADYTSFVIPQMDTSNKYGIPLYINYSFKDNPDETIKDCKIRIKASSDVTFKTQTIEVNGNEWGSFSEYSSGQLYIRDLPVSGSIRLAIDYSGTAYHSCYAEMIYTVRGKEYKELIGVINSPDNVISINIPSETSDKSITVSGITSASNKVDIYVNGEYVDSVYASFVGAYSYKLTLPVSSEKEEFLVEARINEGKSSARSRIIYSDNAVKITSATMIYKNKEYDLIKYQNKLPVIAYSSSSPYTFVIKVNNPSAVYKIAVAEQSATAKNYLMCEYSKELNAYVGTGLTGQVLSNIRIICVTENNAHEIISEFDFRTFEDDIVMKDDQHLMLELKDNSLVEDKENGKLIYDIYQKDDPEGKAQMEIEALPTDDFSVEELKNDSDFTYTEGRYGGGYYIKEYAEPSEGNDSERLIIHVDETGNIDAAYLESVRNVINLVNAAKDVIAPHVKGLVDITSKDGIIGYVSGLITEQCMVWNSDHFAYYFYINAGMSDDFFAALGSGVGAAGVAGKLASSLITIAIKGAMGEPIDLDKDVSKAVLYGASLIICVFIPEIALPVYMLLNIMDLLVALDECGFIDTGVKMKMDPSGYVYECVLSNGVEGAEVTALWIPYDYTAADFWSKDYPELSKAIVWDAEEYDQMNPIMTDEDGFYAWDVPQGWWIVKVEKDGYEIAYSQWMEVPPERFNVNIGLKSLKAPEVEYILAYEKGIEIAFDRYMDIESVNGSNVVISSNGEPIEGSFKAKNEEKTVDGVSFAKVFVFKPSQNLDSSVKVEINHCLSYCGVETEGFEGTYEIEKKIESLSVSERIYTAIGSRLVIEISAYPAEAAFGKKLEVSFANSYMLSGSEDSLYFDQNGKCYLELSALLPGEVDITFSIDGTDLRATARVIFEQRMTVAARIIGDINGDKAVNTKDAVLLAQHLAGWNVTFDEAAADCNGDRAVNTKDAVRLAQKLAGWDIELVGPAQKGDIEIDSGVVI